MASVSERKPTPFALSLSKTWEKCKTERAKLGEELCDRVADATQRRFFGSGKVPYNPPKESPKF